MYLNFNKASDRMSHDMLETIWTKVRWILVTWLKISALIPFTHSFIPLLTESGLIRGAGNVRMSKPRSSSS